MTFYKEFIDHQLLPELQKLQEKYSIWWSFKPDSSLYKYLQEHNHYFLNEYFTPEELLQIINDIVDTHYLLDNTNSSLVILPENLRNVFGTEILYKPNIVQFCLPHIIVTPYAKALELRNQRIYHELTVSPALDIIYTDPTSMFWIHPDLNALLTQNQYITFTWHHLVQLFTDFITNSPDHFTYYNESIVGINLDSPLVKLFKTKYLHTAQCTNLLKLLSKFLGRTNKLTSICNHLNFQISKSDPIFNFIDTIINSNHSLSPSFSQYVFL